MAVSFTILLLLSELGGLDSVTTVSKVSVKAGQSVSIPCLYDAQHENHVKYLCNGRRWSSCTYEAWTDRPQESPKFLISDDKYQRIFTVTIQQLSNEDTDFWCNVVIPHLTDVGTDFHLSVTNDTPILYVKDQEVTGFIGENVSIECHHRNSGEVKWCWLGGQHVCLSSGTINGMAVIVNVTVPNVFTVTMTDLKPESSGWYWCASGDYQMPVHLTVAERATTTTATATSVTGYTAVASDRPTSVGQKSLVISLSLLIAIAIVALSVWLLLKRKKTKAEESATSEVESEVTYSDVKHKRKSSDQADDNVTYSSVVYVKRNSAEVGVLYSTVAPLRHDI